MISWFATRSTVITLIVKTIDGNLEDKIQIQSDQSVRQLKTIIDEKFECDPEHQKLVFHGQELQDEQLLSSYKITDDSTILIMNTTAPPSDPDPDPNPPAKPQRRNMFEKSNPFYPKQSEEPGISHENNDNNPQYFDPILNKLAQYHPSLPLAVMENATPIGDLMRDLTKKLEDENTKLNQEEQSLTAYYYYASLASLSAATKTVASSVYQRLPSKEELSSLSSSTGRVSLSMIQHLHKLVRNTKEEKAAIDRLVLLGFNRRESVEAYVACDKDEALAAVFMSQNEKEITKTKGGNDEEKSVDASVGYVADAEEPKSIMKQRNCAFFKQFQAWMRSIFDDDELYFRYLLLFMRHSIADMSCLEEIHCDLNEEYLISIGIEHTVHRKRIMKAMDLFIANKEKFEKWWKGTIQFKKYLSLFQKAGIWELEELLLQVRSRRHILDIITYRNKDDVEFIWKHIHHLRQSHSLYAHAATIATATTTPAMNTPHAYNPNAMYTPQPHSQGNMLNYSAPPIMAQSDDDEENMNDDSQKEGVITQM